MSPLSCMSRCFASFALACAFAASVGCSSTPPAGPAGSPRAGGTTAVAALPPGTPPILHLALDGNLDDRGSGHFTARAVGNIVYKPGRLGQAAVIKAPSDYIEVDMGKTIDFSKGATLEVWFNVAELKAPPGLTTTQQLVAFEPLALAVQSTGALRGFQTGTDQKTIFFFSDVRLVKPNTWHHAALVADSRHQSTVLYVDGKPQQTNGRMDSPFSANLTQPLRIGLGDKGTWPYGGLIDEVRLYDFGRNSDEVSEDAKQVQK